MFKEMIEENTILNKFNFATNNFKEDDGYILEQCLYHATFIIQFDVANNQIKYSS